MSNTLNFSQIKEELIVKLRNNITDRKARFSITSDLITGVTGTASYACVGGFNNGKNIIKNIRTVTVNGIPKTPYTDYTVDYSPEAVNQITFLTTIIDGDQIVVAYNRETFIYTDFPRVDMDLSKYPSITADIISVTTKPLSIGGKDFVSDIFITITCFDEGTKKTDELCQLVRDFMINNANQFQGSIFYNIPFIYPMTTGPMINDPARSDKIFQRTIDFKMPLYQEAC